MNDFNNYLLSVRDQYEDLPYPARDPEDENKRLMETWTDLLGKINHYCFGGRQNFQNAFRLLIGGGGTGDATIYLAEQLRSTDAEIVHLDMSAASIDIAKQRAAKRGLTNISWVHDSLLNISPERFGSFDYIQCTGVLHHLENPEAGFQALKSVLKPEGAMCLLVYGQIGRTGIYQMQALLRALNGDTTNKKTLIQRARDLIKTSPDTNWYRLGRANYVGPDDNDAEIYDLLLHSQDRAYTVPQLYEWLVDQQGMNIHFTEVGRGNAPYNPRMLVRGNPSEYLERAMSLPIRQQHEIAELLGGLLLIRHTFYLTIGSETEAPYGDPEFAPFIAHEIITGPELARYVDGEQQSSRTGRILMSHLQSGMALELNPGRWAKYILNNIDGQKSFGEIFTLIRGIDKFKKNPPSNEELFADFREIFNFLRSIDRLLLRHKTVTV